MLEEKCVCQNTILILSETFWLSFVIMMYNLIKQCNSDWKMTLFAAKLVSSKPCFYHDILFSTGRRVFAKKWKIIDALCALSPNAGLLSNRWHQCELISKTCSDLPLPTAKCLQATKSVSSSSSWDVPVYDAATFPAYLSSQFKLDLL